MDNVILTFIIHTYINKYLNIWLGLSVLSKKIFRIYNLLFKAIFESVRALLMLWHKVTYLHTYKPNLDRLNGLAVEGLVWWLGFLKILSGLVLYASKQAQTILTDKQQPKPSEARLWLCRAFAERSEAKARVSLCTSVASAKASMPLPNCYAMTHRLLP